MCLVWPVGLEQEGKALKLINRGIFLLNVWKALRIAVLYIAGFSNSSEYSLQFTSASGKQGTRH